MRFIKLFGNGSVAALLMLCKVGLAAESTSFADGFKFGGYGSVGVTLPRDGDAEANVNELSFILAWEGESRFKFFSELEIDKPISWNDDKKFNSKDRALDLERLYVDYNASDKVNFRAGRFLTPVGRWNLIHAAPLVLTTTRPVVTNQFFPNSTNGVMAFGAVPVGNSAFEYSVYIEALKDEIDDDYDVKFKDVKGARFTFGQDFNVGLNLLSFVERSPMHPSYRLAGLDFLTHIKQVELTGEAYKRWESSDKDGGNGAYLQASVPLPALPNWYGVVRVESLKRPDEQDFERWTVGTTWRIKPTQVLKLEFTGGSRDQSESPRGFIASFAVLF